MLEISINPDKKHQTWEGFGASAAWWPTWFSSFPEEKRRELLDKLYGPDGLGMQIYRYNIPANSDVDVTEEERRTPNIETPDGKVDVKLDVNGMQMLREAKAAGATQFVVFSNSPPKRLTRSGTASGGEKGESNLKEGAEAEFAKYLVDVAQQVQKEFKLPTLTLSPINEPQWFWGKDRRNQEGCRYTPQQAAAIIRAVIIERNKRNLKFHIEAPESGAWKSAVEYADALFSDELIRKTLTHYAVHSYWSDLPAKQKTAEYMQKQYPEIKLAMTEYCIMKHGHDLSIDSALEMAQEMHEDISIAHVVCWQWWLAIARGGYTDSLIYANPRTKVVDMPKRYDTMGHFSKFIKPGDVNIEVTSDKDIYTTAFISKNKRQIICVISNMRKEPVDIQLKTGAFKSKSLKAFVTDANQSMQPLTADTKMQLPARSMTTILFN